MSEDSLDETKLSGVPGYLVWSSGCEMRRCGVKLWGAGVRGTEARGTKLGTEYRGYVVTEVRDK